MIEWHSAISNSEGIAVKSPVSGYVMPMTAHPDPVYQHAPAQNGCCIALAQGLVTAPFHASCQLSLLHNRRLRFTHKSGLTLVVEFVPALFTDRIVTSYINKNCQVKAGQPVLQIGPQSSLSDKAFAIVMLATPEAVTKALACERFVETGKDSLFILQRMSETS